MCRLRTCCCCWSVATGTKIIALVQIIVLILVFAGSSVLASLIDNEDYPENENDANLLFGVYLTVSIVSGIQLVFAVLLLFGAVCRKPILMKPWIFVVWISILLTVITVIINSIVFTNNGNNVGLGTTISSAFVSFCLQIYFYFVVYSHYQNLNGSKTPAFGRSA